MRLVLAFIWMFATLGYLNESYGQQVVNDTKTNLLCLNCVLEHFGTNNVWNIPSFRPTIASGACGASTNGTLDSNATDQAGLLTIASATTTTCTVVFGSPFSFAPEACIIQPANAAAAINSNIKAYVSSITTSQWVITGTALASTNWYYHCF